MPKPISGTEQLLKVARRTEIACHRLSLQIRPYIITSKPANGSDPEQHLVSTSGMVETPRLPVEVKVWRDVAKPRSPSESLFQTPRLRVEGRLVIACQRPSWQRPSF